MPNYILLEKITVGAAGASSVTFSSIPQTGYTDLKIVMSARSNRAAEIDDLFIIKPNNSSSNLTYRFVRGSGSGVTSGTSGNMYITATNATASTFSNNEIYIPNYAGSTNKSMSVETVEENNATDSYSSLMAVLWSDTTAISSIVLAPVHGTAFVQYSTFYLYGVAKLGTTPAIVPYATGGDTIMTDGTYWYHAFTASGTFTPQKAISCDYLVVAGGGAGGYRVGDLEIAGGGGGGGGLRASIGATGGGGSLESPISLALSTAYTITVGAGGATYSNGSDSSVAGSGLTTITSVGGGRGGDYGAAGLSGGSGGGGGGRNNNAGGAGTTNQGYAGGNAAANPSSFNSGGGGGGAGQAGSQSASTTGGNGGNGANTGTVWSTIGAGQLVSGNYYFAGGGGGQAGAAVSGGTGGYGGGSNGSTNNVQAANGTANTGGGGGGAASLGGSGIVIVRYAV